MEEIRGVNMKRTMGCEAKAGSITWTLGNRYVEKEAQEGQEEIACGLPSQNGGQQRGTLGASNGKPMVNKIIVCMLSSQNGG